MSARVRKLFDKRFELNEEGIRRIHSDIRKRVPEDKHDNIIFEISRDDSLIFRTSEVDRVLSENNDSTQKISSIELEYIDDSIEISILFDANEGVGLSVVGESRDDVFLIASELKEYIQKEVANITKFSFFNSRFLFLLGSASIAAAMIFGMKSVNAYTSPEDLKGILAGSVDEKVNFLISSQETRASSNKTMGWILATTMGILGSTMIPFSKVINYLVPGNVFLIGKQIGIVNNRRNNAKNLFWGGAVAFFIAMATGYYFFWLSK